jgi:RNA polymerase sigma-70 factor, ECF subfamily
VSATPAVPRSVTEFEAAFESERAFRAWYDNALPRVYAFVVTHAGGDRALAEEITQQTFVEALRTHGKFDGRSDVVTWLCGIARHRLADHFRRVDREERRRMRVVVREVSPRVDVEPFAAIDQRAEVEAVLRTLPALQRAVLLFMYVDGLSMREIARELRRTEGAIESLLGRARANFRRAMGDAIDD